jgi:signal transduction histidine kinase
LRERLEQYAGNGLRVSVEAPEELPPLQAAVYYVAQERSPTWTGMQNATHCHVRLALVDDVLELDVADDDQGMPTNGSAATAGLGLRSMQERATELGGYCRVEPIASGGALVRARLPCTIEGASTTAS